MIDLSTSGAGRSAMRFKGTGLGIIAALALAQTIFADYAGPAWDDAWYVMLAQAGGDFRRDLADRPVAGAIYQFIAERHLLWPANLALHWLGWTSMGLVAMRVWGLLCPSLLQYRIASGLLATAPIICDYQMIVPSSTGILVSVLLGMAAVLLVAPKVREMPRWHIFTRACAGAFLLAAGILLEEYAISAAFGAMVALGLCSLRNGERGERRERILKVIFLLALIIGSYALFWSTSASGREINKPELVLAKPRAIVTYLGDVFRGGSALWFTALGGLLQRIGSLKAIDRISILSIAAGIAMAGVLYVLRRGASEGVLPQERNSAAGPPSRLVLGIVAGILPFLVMRLRFVTEFSDPSYRARYLLPILPLASCLTLCVLLAVLRRRHQWIVLPLCGLLAGFCICEQGLRAVEKRRQLESWGAKIEPFFASDGLTVAVFDIPKGPGYVKDYELTYRISHMWPSDDQNRFWAFADFADAKSAVPGIKWASGNDGLRIQRNTRGIHREGPIERLLWVHVKPDDPDGKVDVIVHDAGRSTRTSSIKSARKDKLNQQPPVN